MMIPAFTARILLPWYMQRLKIAVAASFLPLGLPSHRRVMSGGIAPALPIVTLFSSTTDKLNSVAAAFSLASMLPILSTSTILGIACEPTMLALLFSWMERLRSAVTACSCVLGSEDESRLTSKGMAPASAMHIRLFTFLFASKRISPAAARCSSWFPLNLFISESRPAWS
uniref:Uncharacterized protein n=1 Tax=Arundo donax TaxID=35708 RepID=A0A0A9CHU2_ARUDO